MSAISKLFSKSAIEQQTQQHGRNCAAPIDGNKPFPSANKLSAPHKDCATTACGGSDTFSADDNSNNASNTNKPAGTGFLGLFRGGGGGGNKLTSPRTTLVSDQLAASQTKDSVYSATAAATTRGSFSRQSSFADSLPLHVKPRAQSITGAAHESSSTQFSPVDESYENLHSLEWRAVQKTFLPKLINRSFIYRKIMQKEQLARFNIKRSAALAPSPIKTLAEAGYEFDRLIGGGAFGHVLTAHPLNDAAKRVAIKRMLKREIVKTNASHFIINERCLLAAIDCPFIVELYDAFKDQCYLYFVMKFSNGGNVFEVMRNDSCAGPWPEHACKFYTAQIVLALEYLHMLGVVFRDLKPENLTFSARGDCILIDFGMARQTKGRAYTVCGSLPYMAPEMIERKGYGVAVDYWALGCIIYEMFTRKRAFHVAHEENLLNVILRCESAVKNNMDIPVEPRDVIDHLVESDLSKRYGTLRDGVNDIKCHPWFGDVDWLRMYKQGYEPPYKPNVADAYDDSNFGKASSLSQLGWETSPDMLYAMEFYGF